MNEKPVVLVNVPFDINDAPGMGSTLPMGIVTLATILKNHNMPVVLFEGASIHADYEDRLMRFLENEKPLFVGFSVMTTQIKRSLELTEKIKKLHKDIKIIWGGFHATCKPHQTLENTNIDIVVYGEAIKVIVPLVKSLSNGQGLDSVPNLYYKTEEGEIKNTSKAELADFDEIPDIEYDFIERDVLERFITKKNPRGESYRSIRIITGLGCNFHCTFCHNVIFQSKHRTMTAERIYANMLKLNNKYGITEFNLVDEHFFGDRERLFHFLDLLESGKIKFKFTSTMRASDLRDNYINFELLKRISELGGFYFGVGAESGSDRLLRKMKKGISVEHIKRAAYFSTGADVVFNFSFMAGIPGEKVEELYETIKLILEIRRINPKLLIIGPQIFRPYPGSELYEEAVQNGLHEPKSLEEWVTDYSLSHFKKLDMESTPWLKGTYRQFEKVLVIYYFYELMKRMFQHDLNHFNGEFFTMSKREKIVYPFRLLFSIVFYPLTALLYFRMMKKKYSFVAEYPFVKFLYKRFY